MHMGNSRRTRSTRYQKNQRNLSQKSLEAHIFHELTLDSYVHKCKEKNFPQKWIGTNRGMPRKEFFKNKNKNKNENENNKADKTLGFVD